MTAAANHATGTVRASGATPVSGSGDWRDSLPSTRGGLRRDVSLAPLTWLRVGGPADLVFNPADADDLARFLTALPAGVPVLPLGVGSNLLVRDGGLRGAVVRLGGLLARVEIEGDLVIAGAGALDQRVAQVAQRAGRAGLEFLIGIPGTIGGAVRMNAGAFGAETGDRLAWVEALDRGGIMHRLEPPAIGFAYRRSMLPKDWIVLRTAFRTDADVPAAILARMEAIKAEREAAQPLRVATGGSTFKNPDGKNPDGHKAWQLIDAAGCRGLREGAAMVSEKHCNFLINTGGAIAAEIEALGELVRRRVQDTQGVELDWEIVRVGEPIAAGSSA